MRRKPIFLIYFLCTEYNQPGLRKLLIVFFFFFFENEVRTIFFYSLLYFFPRGCSTKTGVKSMPLFFWQKGRPNTNLLEVEKNEESSRRIKTGHFLGKTIYNFECTQHSILFCFFMECFAMLASHFFVWEVLFS